MSKDNVKEKTFLSVWMGKHSIFTREVNEQLYARAKATQCDCGVYLTNNGKNYVEAIGVMDGAPEIAERVYCCQNCKVMHSVSAMINPNEESQPMLDNEVDHHILSKSIHIPNFSDEEIEDLMVRAANQKALGIFGKYPIAALHGERMAKNIQAGMTDQEVECDLPVVVQASRQHTDDLITVDPMPIQHNPAAGLTYAQAVELAKGSSFTVLRPPVELPPELAGEPSSQNFSAAAARQKILEGRSLPPETFWTEHMNYWKPPEVYDHKRVIADMIEIVDFATSGRIEQMKAATETLAAYLDRFPEMAAEARHVHNLATGAGNRLRLMRMETVEQEAKVAEAQARAFASGPSCDSATERTG